MKRALLIVLLALPAFAFGQPKGVVDTSQIEAVVTVTKVDQKARTVTIKGPQGNLRTLQVPPEAQNLDKVKPGDRFKMVYAEALVLALSRGGEPSASVDRQVKVAPKGGTPGGYVVRTQQVTGVIDAIDYKNRYVALRGPGGQTFALPVSADVKNLDQVKAGDTVTIAFAQALAIQMIAEPKPAKKPAAKKKS
jgi:Cu/Ag efflux protein CusF